MAERETSKLPHGERILLTGVSGQVGRELLHTLAPLGEVIAPLRTEMDLSDAASVRNFVRQVRPRWVVNPGAYTAVDKAESEPEAAHAINREAIAVLAEEALAGGAAVIHFSTDYVFDGSAPEPYTETDATGPIGVYGRSKLAGEHALEQSGAAHTIFRTSWVYGSAGRNFALTILRLARERESLKIVADQHGSPTWSRDLANLTAHFVAAAESRARGALLAEVVREMGGLYHAAGSGYTTWHGFASEIVETARMRDPSTRWAEIQPITTAEYPTPAKRPVNSRLNCARLQDRLGWRMMDWREALRDVMAEL